MKSKKSLLGSLAPQKVLAIDYNRHTVRQETSKSTEPVNKMDSELHNWTQCSMYLLRAHFGAALLPISLKT